MGKNYQSNENAKKRRSFGSIFERSKTCYEATYYVNKEKFTFSTTTYEEADARLNKIEAELQLNQYSVGSKMFLKDWLKYWMKTYIVGKVKNATVSHYRGNIDNHINPALGNVPLYKLSVERLQVFFNEKAVGGRADGKEGGLSKKTLNNIRLLLHEALQQAVIDGKLNVNYVSDVKLGKIKKPDARVLAKEEQTAIERITEASVLPTNLGIIIDLYTGMRLGELLGRRKIVWS